jgi:hypothetical protein
MDALTRGLLMSGKHEVKILTVATEKHPFQPDELETGIPPSHTNRGHSSGYNSEENWMRSRIWLRGIATTSPVSIRLILSEF